MDNDYERQRRIMQHRNNYSGRGDETLGSSLLSSEKKIDPSLRAVPLSASNTRLDQSFVQIQNGRPRTNTNRAANCIKYFLICLNCIYMVLGLGLLGVGIFLVIDRSYLAPIIEQMLLIATPSIMMIGGAIIFLITFVGCGGAAYEKKCLLIFYFIVMIVAILILTVVSVLGVIILYQVGDSHYVREAMRRNLQMYYGIDQQNWYNRIVTEGWDNAQSRLHCCAVEEQSWDIYKGSAWFKEQPGEPRMSASFEGPPSSIYKPYVPPSCCKKNSKDQYYDLVLCQTNPIGPPSMQSGIMNTALHYRGCYSAAVQFLEEHAPILIGLGAGVGFLIVLGPIFAICLYVRIA